MLAYVAIYVAAIIEGEVYYVTQCSLAVNGTLAWAPVIVAGALGGATGDHIWFYLIRGRLDWLERFPRAAKYQDRVSGRVRSHETLILLASRFLPGLRTAIPVACAVAGVSRLKFSLLNLTSAFAWASSIMLFVKGGSKTLNALGLDAWWGPFIPAGLLLLFVYWIGRPGRSDRHA